MAKQKEKKIKITEDNLKDSLNEQYHFLLQSASQFDKGNFFEAKRLATTSRVLLRDTRNSASLLKQLGVKDSLLYYNTSLFIKDVVLYSGPVTIATIPNKLNGQYFNTYWPLFDEYGPSPTLVPLLSFDHWYNTKMLINGIDSFTRKEIIGYLADQDGGAHIDAEIDKKYHNLKQSVYSMSMQQLNTFSKNLPFENLHYALMRQIAHELIVTLNKNFYFNEKYEPLNTAIKDNVLKINIAHLAINEGEGTIYGSSPYY
ncbi:hypothetical protein NE256_13100 [Enterococcus faecium]|uniref:hypothetical protein n=1 Tax=Enterococcus faecium TaxID=1352 RepID=UPI00071B98AF|nr:hypothetical protein [Enterococcus faecium]KST49673.1 hypothetical protein AOY35_08690 [Enterococcus faecium]MCM6872051.1 hypothetical protein [Enterococcus faecium]MCM6877279.1 hypothetical protein [Enterococcus faecium]MCM6889880.1 hypothetical protein [Enterococcus faecium]MCM6892571.1 hypothetical protein [Enterococcus faecium]